VFGANITILIYGDGFWPTYTTGDNTGLIATDSMKNFVQREMLNFTGSDLEDCCRFFGAKFLDLYPQVEGVQMSAIEIPYAALPNSDVAFAPAGPDRATARLELNREGVAEIASGIQGFKLLRLGGSAFHGFVRDQYTTLPDIANRPLHMWLDLEWLYTESAAGFSSGTVTAAVRRIVRDVFHGFESGSIQQVIYQIGNKILSDIPSIAEVHLEANNRTWDTIAERGDELGVYTEARPPFGVLGLGLKR
jgi:urate oxidase